MAGVSVLRILKYSFPSAEAMVAHFERLGVPANGSKRYGKDEHEHVISSATMPFEAEELGELFAQPDPPRPFAETEEIERLALQLCSSLEEDPLVDETYKSMAGTLFARIYTKEA